MRNVPKRRAKASVNTLALSKFAQLIVNNQPLTQAAQRPGLSTVRVEEVRTKV